MNPFIPFFDSMADLLESKAGASDLIGGSRGRTLDRKALKKKRESYGPKEALKLRRGRGST
jgi:hypothetical protein